MSALWGSARQALGYMYSARRGPSLRQPRYTDAPGTTGHGKWDHVLVAALLYGDPDTPGGETGLGVEPGSELDEALWTWALDRTASAGPEVLEVVAGLTRLMEEHSLRAKVHVPERGDFVRWTYEDGTRGLRMRVTADTLGLGKPKVWGV